VATLETRSMADAVDLIELLTKAGVDAARRSLRVIPTDWRVEQIDERDWRLQFHLPKGCFATSLVRELARTDSSPEESGVNVETPGPTDNASSQE
jgi:tRNA pseudouridine13 synthase